MSPEPNLINKLKALTADQLVAPAEKLAGKTDISGLGTGVGASQTGVIPERYKDVSKGWSPFSLPKDMEAEAAKSQSAMSVLANTLSGFGKQAVGGFLKGISSWDLKGIADMALGNTE